jgi:hypothetical protein
MPRALREFTLPADVGSALTLGIIGLMSMTQVLPAGLSLYRSSVHR